jgi:hypothetical protein
MKKILVLLFIAVGISLISVKCVDDVSAEVVKLKETAMELPSSETRNELLNMIDQIGVKISDLKASNTALTNQNATLTTENADLVVQNNLLTGQVTSLQNELDVKQASVDSLLLVEQALWERALTDSLFLDTLKNRMQIILSQ